MNKKNNLIINDSITRNDLIEYAISKKVEEVKLKKIEVEKTANSVNKTNTTEIKKLEKKLKELYTKETTKYISDNYGETIKIMEENLKTKHVILTRGDENHRDPLSEIAYMFHLGSTDSIILFPDDDSPMMKNDRFMIGHPMMIFSSIKSFIKIDSSSIKSAEIDIIKDEIKKKQTEINSAFDIVRSIDAEISNIRNQKDIIKNRLIEEALSKTDEGKGMLEILNTLDISMGQKMLN
jgi:hypothetical protein